MLVETVSRNWLTSTPYARHRAHRLSDPCYPEHLCLSCWLLLKIISFLKFVKTKLYTQSLLPTLIKNFSFSNLSKNTRESRKLICHRKVKITITHVVFGNTSFWPKIGNSQSGPDMTKMSSLHLLWHNFVKASYFVDLLIVKLRTCWLLINYVPDYFIKISSR